MQIIKRQGGSGNADYELMADYLVPKSRVFLPLLYTIANYAYGTPLCTRTRLLYSSSLNLRNPPACVDYRPSCGAEKAP